MKKTLGRYTLCSVLVAILLCSCAKGKPDVGQPGQGNGQQQLTVGDLRQQAAILKKRVKLEPANGPVNFSYGRVLLATNQPRQALVYLEKAVLLVPDNAEYLLWQGVAYGENTRRAEERASYQQALQYDNRNVLALVYLGNSFLTGKAYEQALDCYQRALVIAPENDQALYNRALICKQLQRTPEEILAWRLYLASHPSGLLARKAADHLNLHEDFSFRNHCIGPRILTLPAIAFVPLSAELAPAGRAALDQLGNAVIRLPKGRLDLLVYQKNNRELARKRSVSIQRYLENTFEALKTGKRIRLSWFDQPEKRKIAGRTARIDESVVFFLSDLPAPNMTKAKKRKKRVVARHFFT